MPKYKLSLDDLESPIQQGFGVFTTLGPLKFCAEINQLLAPITFTRFKEDLIEDYKGNRFFYAVYAYEDPLREIDWRLVFNRSYRSETSGQQGIDLFSGEAQAEKNWLNNKDGYNFFLWFEGENQSVSFLHEVKGKLMGEKKLGVFKELSDTELNKLTKSQKYYHGL